MSLRAPPRRRRAQVEQGRLQAGARIPQKGPALDMGSAASARMVGFYGVLAAAVAAALAYQG